MGQTAVFLDGGYLTHVLKGFSYPRVDYARLAEWACKGDSLFRAYYYDCLPYQGPNPTQEERERVSNAHKFYTRLRRLPRFTVREGRLAFRGLDSEGRPIFEQKRIDLLLGIDMASLSSKRRVEAITLIAGDSDFIPVVEYARDEGVIVRLAHGPFKTYHQDLWDAVDERLEITKEVLDAMPRP